MKRLFRLSLVTGLAILLGGVGIAPAQPRGFRLLPGLRPHFELPRFPAPRFELPRVNPGFGRSGMDFPLPARSFRTPVESVRTSFGQMIQTRPEQAFRIGLQEASSLNPQELSTLRSLAVKELAGRAEHGITPWKTMGRVQEAIGHADPKDFRVQAQLHSVKVGLERRALRESLQDVLGGQKAWSRAGTRARSLLERGVNRFAKDGKEAAKIKGALKKIAAQRKKAALLDKVTKGLKASAEGRFGESASLLRGVRKKIASRGRDTESLPAQLLEPTRGLEALTQIRAQASAVWNRPPNVRALKTALGRLEQSITRLPADGVDAGLVKSLRQDLAVKAFLDGHPTQARALLPADGPADHAANLLRDVKVLVGGKGEVGTWPCRRVLLPEPGRGANPPRGPPPGLRPVTPEGAREGWRPQPRESAREALPPLDRVARLEKTWRAMAEAALRQPRTRMAQRTGPAFALLRVVLHQMQQQDDEERRRLATLEGLLNRDLDAAERAQALHLLRKDKTVRQVLVDLAEDDELDEAELDEVEAVQVEVRRQLNRNLSVPETRQLARLFLQDRKATEIAYLLAEAEVGTGKR
jgi:hypothetical protein